MIRRCDYQFMCPICGVWLYVGGNTCELCGRYYSKCKYYESRQITPIEFQTYAKHYGLRSIENERGWCNKYNELINETYSNNKFYRKDIVCDEKYNFDDEHLTNNV